MQVASRQKGLAVKPPLGGRRVLPSRRQKKDDMWEATQEPKPLTARQERELFKKELAQVVEIVTSQRAYALVEESLDEVARERAEKIVQQKLPGL